MSKWPFRVRRLGGWSQVHNNATAWPNLGLLDSNQLDSKMGPSVAKMIKCCLNVSEREERLELLEMPRSPVIVGL